jgi:hypothetical protein
MLTMQPEPAKRRIIREAHRLLDGSAGRYGIHELCLLPDDLDPALAERITADLAEAIHVGARPLTPAAWSELLADEGFTVTSHRTAPMALLEQMSSAVWGPVAGAQPSAWASQRSGPKTSYRMCRAGTPARSSCERTARMKGTEPHR